MKIEKRLDENGKLELVVHQENEELYTELKGFRKVFLPLLGEHRIVKSLWNRIITLSCPYNSGI